jgi:hypothetical protein
MPTMADPHATARAIVDRYFHPGHWDADAVERLTAEIAAAIRAARAEERAEWIDRVTDRRSGRPQCRGCYEYLDKPKETQLHTVTCWTGLPL